MTNELSPDLASSFLSKDVDQLYAELGLRKEATVENTALMGDYDPALPTVEHMGGLDSLKKIGQRMFNKVHQQAHALVCGDDPDDAEDRQKVSDALNLSSESAVIAIASVLVGSLGIGAVFAGVLAALIVKRFLQPALSEGHAGLCEAWEEYLPSQPQADEPDAAG